jgi:hypothetical protein
MSSIQWEYHLELMSPDSAEASGMLNRLGRESWELVSVMADGKDPDSRVAPCANVT